MKYVLKSSDIFIDTFLSILCIRMLRSIVHNVASQRPVFICCAALQRWIIHQGFQPSAGDSSPTVAEWELAQWAERGVWWPLDWDQFSKWIILIIIFIRPFPWGGIVFSKQNSMNHKSWGQWCYRAESNFLAHILQDQSKPLSGLWCPSRAGWLPPRPPPTSVTRRRAGRGRPRCPGGLPPALPRLGGHQGQATRAHRVGLANK